MPTLIHVSRKLEKIIPGTLSSEVDDMNVGPLGVWNAQLFYIGGKKCWLIVNAKTCFSIVIPSVTAQAYKQIGQLFFDAFIEQVNNSIKYYDPNMLSRVIGEVNILPTNGDKSTIAIQNLMLSNIKYWKRENPKFEDWDIGYRNDCLNQGLYRGPDYIFPYKEMEKLLDEIVKP